MKGTKDAVFYFKEWVLWSIFFVVFPPYSWSSYISMAL